ncbi:MAG: dockerin type I domain-containing protein [Oscillospiraceae bacterium]|nr:dockerin type I domain-containing protein [Oscillospiraceae bacterium]
MDATPSTVKISEADNGGNSSPTYTATATGDDTATVGTPFDVAVTLTAAPTTSEFAQAEVALTYDATLVTPDLTGLDNVSDSTVPGTLTITKVANGGLGAAVGDGALLATIPFEPIAAGEATFSVSTGASVSFVKKQGEDTFDIVAGEDLVVEISAATPAYEFDDAYNGLPTGYKLLLKEISADDAAKVWTYDGAAMHNIYKNSKYYATYIVANTVTAETAGTIVITATAYSVSANINGDGKVNISDSQIAFDFANGYVGYLDSATLTIAIRLAADVNGDGQVTSTDAQAINYAIHHSGNLPD